MKAVILVRVSTREQEEDGLSIIAQKTKLIDQCKNKGFDVLEVFEIVESSSRGTRKKFFEIISFIKQQKEKVAFVVDCVDRMQRSFKESTILDDLRKEGKIEIHFIRENLILNENSRGSDLIMWNMYVVTANSYILNISDNVKRTNEYKLRKGEVIGPVPVGYLNTRDSETGKSQVIVDPVRSHLVKRGFELYASGNYSFQKVADILREEGLTNNKRPHRLLSTSQIHSILKHPFYIGFIPIKGELYPHSYPRFIDDHLYYKCEEVRLGWHKKPFKYNGKMFLFKGLIRCGVCGRAVSSDKKKGKLSTHLVCGFKYRGCKEAERVNEAVLIDQVKDLFKNLTIPENVLIDLKDKLKKTSESEKDFHQNALKEIRKEYDSTQEKLSKLLDIRLEGSITKEEYDKKANELKLKQHELDIKQKQYTEADKSFAITVNYLLDLSSRAYELFESSNTEQKRQLLNYVCTDLTLNGKKLDYKLKKPFDAIFEANTHSMWLRD